jgi:nucleoside-diphosphate-sugar epimerase
MKILVMGGNRFFGRHLVKELLSENFDVTVLNRGNLKDDFGTRVKRITADRKESEALTRALGKDSWDLVYDQVCYSAQEARDACRVFAGRTQRYVVTSSESVYDGGLDQPESHFSPGTYSFSEDVSPEVNYQTAKRQMETVFTAEAPFSFSIVRPSLVVGIDDYTGRLQWHIERMKLGKPLYFPSLELKTDFIRSDQMGLAMKTIGLSKQSGPVNCTAPGSIKLGSLVKMCEEALGAKAVLASKNEGDNHSPYGVSYDRSMSTNRLQSLSCHIPASSEWMGGLIQEIVAK